jgi:hypothetical protein
LNGFRVTWISYPLWAVAARPEIRIAKKRSFRVILREGKDKESFRRWGLSVEV